MALWLEERAADFESRFGALLAAKRESAADVNQAVAEIVERVRRDKDEALDRSHLALRPRGLAQSRHAGDPS